MHRRPVKILVAGVGNLLRADDGFGVEVARRLADETLPDGVRVIETGIAGIALIGELQEGWDALVVIDAVDHQRAPGTVLVIEPTVIDVHAMSFDKRRDMLADMHMATPELALMLAAALGVLPERRILVGCQIADPDAYGEGLSPEVTAAVEHAIVEVRRCIDGFIAAIDAATAVAENVTILR